MGTWAFVSSKAGFIGRIYALDSHHVRVCLVMRTFPAVPRAAHRTVLRLRPYILRPYFYKISCYPYRKVILKKLDGTVRVKKRVYGRIYGFLRRHK